jgi:hypothetical protein
VVVAAAGFLSVKNDARAAAATAFSSALGFGLSHNMLLPFVLPRGRAIDTVGVLFVVAVDDDDDGDVDDDTDALLTLVDETLVVGEVEEDGDEAAETVLPFVDVDVDRGTTPVATIGATSFFAVLAVVDDTMAALGVVLAPLLVVSLSTLTVSLNFEVVPPLPCLLIGFFVSAADTSLLSLLFDDLALTDAAAA